MQFAGASSPRHFWMVMVMMPLDGDGNGDGDVDTNEDAAMESRVSKSKIKQNTARQYSDNP